MNQMVTKNKDKNNSSNSLVFGRMAAYKNILSPAA